MNFNLASRLVALAVGATLVLDALSRAVALLATHGLDKGTALYILSAVPILVALVMARFIFVYARRLQFEEVGSVETGVFAAGVKLFGIYLVVKAIPALVSTASGTYLLFSAATDDFDLSIFVRNALIGAIWILVGLVFVTRTQWVIRFAGASEKL